MQAYNEAMSGIRERGGILLAISPMLPEKNREFRESLNLGFNLLTDRGNEYARRLGLSYEVPREVMAAYRRVGLELPAFNGDNSWTLPVTAVFGVRAPDLITYAWKETDYTRRPEIEEILEGMFSDAQLG